ncbi:hypothetical protein EBZ39_03115 [bacterium]|nr:hypothetical protein [bacterium]
MSRLSLRATSGDEAGNRPNKSAKAEMGLPAILHAERMSVLLGGGVMRLVDQGAFLTIVLCLQNEPDANVIYGYSYDELFRLIGQAIEHWSEDEVDSIVAARIEQLVPTRDRRGRWQILRTLRDSELRQVRRAYKRLHPEQVRHREPVAAAPKPNFVMR